MVGLVLVRVRDAVVHPRLPEAVSNLQAENGGAATVTAADSDHRRQHQQEQCLLRFVRQIYAEIQNANCIFLLIGN